MTKDEFRNHVALDLELMPNEVADARETANEVRAHDPEAARLIDEMCKCAEAYLCYLARKVLG